MFLNKLYPNYVARGIDIIFTEVQKQENFSDCGVFAIANATTLFFNKLPENIDYDILKMRPHLREML